MDEEEDKQSGKDEGSKNGGNVEEDKDGGEGVGERGGGEEGGEGAGKNISTEKEREVGEKKGMEEKKSSALPVVNIPYVPQHR